MAVGAFASIAVHSHGTGSRAGAGAMRKRQVMNNHSLLAVMTRWAVVLVAAASVSGCDLFTSVETRIGRAEERIAVHDYRGAMIELRNALQSEPENSRARRLLAEASLQLGDVSGAEADLRRAIEYGESPADLAELAARIRLAAGRFEELLTAIDADELVLGEPARTLYRGRALIGMRRFAEALEQFEGAQESSGAMDVAIAEAQAGLGRFDDALQRLAEVVDQEPQNAPALLLRGRLLAARGQFDDARASLEKVHEVDAGQLDARQRSNLLSTLIEVYLARGEIATAETTLQAFARSFPEAPLTRFLSARIALVRQDYEAAAAELERIVNAVPQFIQARFLLGAVFLAQGRLQQADLHLSQVVQNAPENIEARKLLAQVRMRLERPGEAVQVLVPAVQVSGFDPQVTALLGAAQTQAGHTGGEIPVLEESLVRNPENPEVLLSLATAYLREGEPRRALVLLRSEPARRGGPLKDALMIAALGTAEGPAAVDAELNRLLRERPDDLDILNLAAEVFTQRAEFDRGRALLTRAFSRSAEHPATLLGMARLEAAAGHPTVAEGYLQKLLEVESDNATARLGLVDLALRHGNRQTAIEHLEGWRAADMAALEPRFRLARLYLQGNQLDAAQAALDEVVARSADTAAAHSMVGSTYLDLGRYEQAIGSFRAAVDARDDRPGYWLNLARAQLASEQRAAARESLSRALALRPDWVLAVGVEVMIDLRDGNRQAALQRVNALRERFPQDAAVLLLEGDTRFAMREYAEASRIYDAAYALRPEAPVALRSYQARRQGRLVQAVEPLNRWLAQNPGDVRVRMVLAEAYQAEGDARRAVKEYEIVVRDGPPNAAALNNLAWLYQQQGDRRAADTAQHAYALAPSAPAVADTYGWILVQSGRVDDGAELLEQALKDAPDVPDIRYHHAVAVARLGRHAEARQALSELLASGADFADRAEAMRLLAELSAQLMPSQGE